MQQKVQYIAFQFQQDPHSIVNIFNKPDVWREVEVFAVGDVFTMQQGYKGYDNAKEKAVKKSQRMYGKGPRHKQHMEYIFVVPVRELIRRFPFMRPKLSEYDAEYVAYRNRVDENKRIRDSKKKVGIRFG